ncbi:nuclease-related domain-containing protein [Salipaludibacillus sp. HK11]|uniref:nuclease-related domain-containing protein n=1 Tax=Salipaludibacillus sp. HK11 TaxID=3394320 RepID=UPI0039FC3CCD
MAFSENVVREFENMEKGYQGELIFDSWLENLTMDSIILNDLLFKVNQSEFQIDSLIIYSKGIMIFEVKYFNGDYYIENKTQKWLTRYEANVQNPIHQVERAETNFRKLLYSFRGPKIDLLPYVVFTNPEFTLFQASMNIPIILPSQINSFINKLNVSNNPKVTQRHFDLATKILASQIEESPYKRLPEYHFDTLKKGVTCSRCKSFMSSQKRKFVCEACGRSEFKNIGIERSVTEFQQLFPDRQITTKLIMDWINLKASKKTVRKFLMRNFNKVGYGPATYFVNRDLK